MLRYIFLLSYLLAATVIAYPQYDGLPNQDILVETRSGMVKGKSITLPDERGEVYAYLGIPFAEPPLGELRFRLPVPIASWEGVRDAVNYSNSCMQQRYPKLPGLKGVAMMNANTPVSEDCLYLNVWTASPRPNNASVMIWIYGGGYIQGTASLDFYDGRFLAGIEDVIIVSMNYRVGSFGFLATGDGRAKGNYGLLDQLLAMKWVKENIAAFGGNPTSVTIFGQSVGGNSIGLHLMSHLSRPFFKRAIMQSSPYSIWGFINRDQSKIRSTVLGETVGCKYTDPNFVDCLRNVPADIISRNELVTVNFCEFPWVPVVDGHFLLDEPSILIQDGYIKKTDVLMGANKNEGTVFIVEIPGYENDALNLQTYDSYLSNIDLVNYDLQPCSRAAVKARYTPWGQLDNGIVNRDSLGDIVGDRVFLCPIVDLAYKYTDMNLNVYLYYFSHRASNQEWPEWMGVIHTAEIQFVFGMPIDPSHGYSQYEVQISEIMMASWTNFAKYGDPNKGKTVPFWPKQTVEGREFLEIPSFRRGKDLRNEYCELFSELIPRLEKEKDCW
ncbi:cholinesterase-like [Glandiceps talaboti]